MTYLVNSMGHVQVNVTDMDAVIGDAKGILGLHVTRQSDDVAWLSSNGRMAELILHRAGANAVRSIGFEAVSANAVDEAVHRATKQGWRVISEKPTLECCAVGAVFATRQGHTFEIHTAIADAMHDRRHFGGGVGPLRLDHVNIISPDPVQTRKDVEVVLGLKLSERMVDDGLSWMRGANRLHHILGIVRGPTGLHHISFEFGNFTDYCRLGDLLDQANKELVWGPGRHRPGDNTYAYYIDSSGAMVECSGGMAMIADDDTYEPNIITALKRPENVRVMNVWGTPAPSAWLTHTFPFAPPQV